VRAEAGVDADAELPGRAETLLADELRPDEEAGVSATITSGRVERGPALHGEREAEALFDAKDAPLCVERDVAEGLRIERLFEPAVRRARGTGGSLRVADHEVDRGREADDHVVEQPEVELERAGEAVRDEMVGAEAADFVLVIEAHQRAPVIDDEPEAEIEVTDDVASVGVEEALRVEGGTEKVRIEAAPVRDGGLSIRVRRRDHHRSCRGERQKVAQCAHMSGSTSSHSALQNPRRRYHDPATGDPFSAVRR
jgi:hypothetical protein